jgi:1-acyl-sn-glycerol-3-phosphate acyltransferase
MLLGLLCALSFMAAVLLCAGTGAFDTFAFLWLIPVGFLGTFLVLLALGFGIFLLICRFIDPEKQRDKDSPWFRWLVQEIIDLLFKVLPIKLRTKGFENAPKDGRFLLVCNHLDNIDPAFLLHCLRQHSIAFVAKQEAKHMFLVNKVMPMLLCPYINRENDKEALKTILRCISLLKTDTVSVGIFPEGRINKYRKLAHFRPGVFKIAQKAQVPIVVCTLTNTHKVLKNFLHLKHTDIDLHLLAVIQPEEYREVTTVDLADRIYTMMSRDLGPEYVLEENT